MAKYEWYRKAGDASACYCVTPCTGTVPSCFVQSDACTGEDGSVPEGGVIPCSAVHPDLAVRPDAGPVFVTRTAQDADGMWIVKGARDALGGETAAAGRFWRVPAPEYLSGEALAYFRQESLGDAYRAPVESHAGRVHAGTEPLHSRFRRVFRYVSAVDAEGEPTGDDAARITHYFVPEVAEPGTYAMRDDQLTDPVTTAYAVSEEDHWDASAESAPSPLEDFGWVLHSRSRAARILAGKVLAREVSPRGGVVALRDNQGRSVTRPEYAPRDWGSGGVEPAPPPLGRVTVKAEERDGKWYVGGQACARVRLLDAPASDEAEQLRVRICPYADGEFGYVPVRPWHGLPSLLVHRSGYTDTVRVATLLVTDWQEIVTTDPAVRAAAAPWLFPARLGPYRVAVAADSDGGWVWQDRPRTNVELLLLNREPLCALYRPAFGTPSAVSDAYAHACQHGACAQHQACGTCLGAGCTWCRHELCGFEGQCVDNGSCPKDRRLCKPHCGKCDGVDGCAKPTEVWAEALLRRVARVGGRDVQAWQVAAAGAAACVTWITFCRR